MSGTSIEIFSKASLLYQPSLVNQSDEVLFKIFDQLSPEDLNKISETSKRFRQAVDNYIKVAPKTSPTWKAPVNFNIEKIKGDPTALSKFIRDLDLSQFKHFTPEDLEAFLKFFPNITSLKLPPDINNDHLKALASMTKLQHLNLRACDGITDAGLVHLEGLKELHHLDLANCRQINGAGLVHLKDLKELHHLNLANCHRITNAGLVHLKDLKELHYLNLTFCFQITDAGLVHLKDLKELHHLGLAHCGISDRGLVHLEDLKELHYLDLAHCGISGGLVHLKDLKELHYLDLTHSQVTDSPYALAIFSNNFCSS